MSMNAKRGQFWGEAELLELKALIDGGRTVPEIAKILNRTREGVSRRAALEGWYAFPSRLYRPILSSPATEPASPQ